jgi:hypothetical protein
MTLPASVRAARQLHVCQHWRRPLHTVFWPSWIPSLQNQKNCQNNMKYYKLYALKPVSGGRGNRIPLHKLGEAASVRNACNPRSVLTRSSSFQVLVAVQVLTSLTLLLHSASFQLDSILDSDSILEAQMSSESGAAMVHRRFACMGCTARSGEPTFFNDYQLAARSIHCNKSTHWIKAVTVQLIICPQHLSRWSAWRLAPPISPIRLG